MFKVKSDLLDTGAEFSPCRKYRYKLWRVWDKTKEKVTFIGLNPSTATEEVDDPTVAKCQRYARAWGYGGIYMANIFAFRATDPLVMKAESDPVGDRNNIAILEMACWSSAVICCWGNHGAHLFRSRELRKILSWTPRMAPKVYFLKMNNGGEPAHPLYLKGNLKPTFWEGLWP